MFCFNCKPWTKVYDVTLARWYTAIYRQGYLHRQNNAAFRQWFTDMWWLVQYKPTFSLHWLFPWVRRHQVTKTLNRIDWLKTPLQTPVYNKKTELQATQVRFTGKRELEIAHIQWNDIGYSQLCAISTQYWLTLSCARVHFHTCDLTGWVGHNYASVLSGIAIPAAFL